MKTSKLSENLKGSEILKVGMRVRELIENGKKIYNLTIGDFDTSIFSMPQKLKEAIAKAYSEGQTNYPVANGEPVLRKNAVEYLKKVGGPNYSEDEILVSAGARPLIYSFYRTIIDPSDTVLFPVPSWNNDAYSLLNAANSIIIHTKAENNFIPAIEDILPHISNVSLIALCSPLNPSGTVFRKDEIENICDLILSENENRVKENKKPVYLLYDSIYWQLTYGEIEFFHPVNLRPAMKDFMISIDGISKSFSATGLRVGWAYGPKDIIKKMAALLSHVGAWAPKPEQLGTAEFLNDFDEVQKYLTHHKLELLERLNAFYHGFKLLKSEGFQVDAIRPEAALYLSINLNLKGKITASGKVLNSARDITDWLLDEVGVAMVPFYAFGTSDDLCWFRLSVGRVKIDEIPDIIDCMRKGLSHGIRI